MKFVRFIWGVDVTFCYVTKMLHLEVRVKLSYMIILDIKKTALRDAKLFQMLFISVFKFCHECQAMYRILTLQRKQGIERCQIQRSLLG